MPFEPSDEFIWTVDLISHPIDAKKSLLLPKALKALRSGSGNLNRGISGIAA